MCLMFAFHFQTSSGSDVPKTSAPITSSVPGLALGGGGVGGGGSGMKTDSDEGDIVPSTTTTPERERGRRLMWDYAADLGGGNHIEGMMSDITAESSPEDPHSGG